MFISVGRFGAGWCGGVELVCVWCRGPIGWRGACGQCCGPSGWCGACVQRRDPSAWSGACAQCRGPCEPWGACVWRCRPIGRCGACVQRHAQLDGVLLLRSVVAQVDGVNCLCTVSWPIRMVQYLWLGQVKKFHLYFESWSRIDRWRYASVYIKNTPLPKFLTRICRSTSTELPQVCKSAPNCDLHPLFSRCRSFVFLLLDNSVQLAI